MVGFTKSTHTNSSLEAELHALLEGLQTTQEWKLFSLKIETDSTEVIRYIYQGNRLYDDIVNACRLLMH